MSKELINEAQKSLPSSTFGSDITNMLGMGASMPASVVGGAVNDHVSSQIDHTMSDMMDFPHQAAEFKNNGVESMVNGVDALHAGGSLGMVESSVWSKMAGFGSDVEHALGFDPASAAGDPSIATVAMNEKSSSSRGKSDEGKQVAEQGIDTLKDASKTVNKVASKDAAKGADAGEEALSMGGKALDGVADLAKSPAGKILGKAALPLGLVGGAVALGSDAGTFGDAITDPFDTKKLGKARDALRKDLPVPGAPLVIDAVTDPSKLLDAGKDIGKAVTDPSMDSFKKAGSKVMDELGF